MQKGTVGFFYKSVQIDPHEDEQRKYQKNEEGDSGHQEEIVETVEDNAPDEPFVKEFFYHFGVFGEFGDPNVVTHDSGEKGVRRNGSEGA